MKLVKREIDLRIIQKYLSIFPATGILGARQCGKTSIARQIGYDHFFDLESMEGLGRLDNPQTALEKLSGLIVIDEVQRKPELFPLLRYLMDTHQDQKYLILGSASRDLIRQSSESLAGRIGYCHLGGFRLSDIGSGNMPVHWLRGGFPRAYLADTDETAFIWLEQYIQNFLEQDIPALGIAIPAYTLGRFWTMLAHYHGQILNYSELARSFGISDMTVRKYIDILTGTFMVRLLLPWFTNTGKRLIRHPKLYIRDSGIFHSLMSIRKGNQLETHNKLGASWEGYALETACTAIGKRDEEYYFWKTHSGAELDLLWIEHGKRWGIEFKYRDAPRLTKSMLSAADDLGLEHLWVLYPGRQRYKLAPGITVLPVCEIPENWCYERD